MERRTFVATLAGGLLSGPLAARAQPAGKPSRVGVLSGKSAVGNPQIQALRESLQALGWVDGRDIVIETRFADGHMDRLGSLAVDLVRLDMQVIVAGPYSGASRAAGDVDDPDRHGRRGGSDQARIRQESEPSRRPYDRPREPLPELGGKPLQLLAELIPGLIRVAALLNPDNPLHEGLVPKTEADANLVGLQLVVVRARTPEEFTAPFDAIVKAKAGAVNIWGDPMFARHRTGLIDLAMRSRLPTMFVGKQSVVAGGLVSYGPDYVDIY